MKESKETKVEKASDKPITHEELIDEDIEKAKHQSNEKDDANTDVLAEEGALVNEDDYDLVDKKELEKEGITTEEEAPLNIKEKKSEKTVQEDVLESSVKKDDEKPILDVESKEAKKVADVEEKVASEQPPLDIVEKSSKETEEKETDETTKEELPVGTKVEDSEKDTTTLKSEVEELEKSEEQPLDIKKKEVVETKDDVATENLKMLNRLFLQLPKKQQNLKFWKLKNRSPQLLMMMIWMIWIFRQKKSVNILNHNQFIFSLH